MGDTWRFKGTVIFYYRIYLDGGVVAVQDSGVKVALDADVVACKNRAASTEQRRDTREERSVKGSKLPRTILSPQ